MYVDENITYKVWDHTIEGAWDSYKKPIRVIRSEKIKKSRHHLRQNRKMGVGRREGRLVLKLPACLKLLVLKNVVLICHGRWQIENCCFGELVDT